MLGLLEFSNRRLLDSRDGKGVLILILMGSNMKLWLFINNLDDTNVVNCLMPSPLFWLARF